MHDFIHPGPVASLVSGDVEVAVPPSGLTLIVGANSSGKTTALRDVASGCSVGMFGDVRLVVHEVRFVDPGREALETIADRFTFTRNGSLILHAKDVEALVDGEANNLSFVAQRFKNEILTAARETEVSILDGAGRLGLVDPQEADDLLNATHGSPMQRLVVNDVALRELSDGIYEAFGKRLCIDPPGRKQIQLYVGSPPGEDVSDPVERARRIAALPTLVSEGDGLKAYTGILLSLLGQRKRFTFVDEPEAFLHPPQARQLGRSISRLAAEEGLQVFIATHSRDVILGALDSGHTPTIVRLDRSARDPAYAAMPIADR